MVVSVEKKIQSKSITIRLQMENKLKKFTIHLRVQRLLGTLYILYFTVKYSNEFYRIRTRKIFYCQIWAHKGKIRIHIKIEITN